MSSACCCSYASLERGWLLEYMVKNKYDPVCDVQVCVSLLCSYTLVLTSILRCGAEVAELVERCKANGREGKFEDSIVRRSGTVPLD